MAQKRTTLRGWKKPEDGKSSACRLISSFVCIFGRIKWYCSKSSIIVVKSYKAVLVRILLLAMSFFVSKGGPVSQSCSTAASWTDPDGKASATQKTLKKSE